LNLLFLFVLRDLRAQLLSVVFRLQHPDSALVTMPAFRLFQVSALTAMKPMQLWWNT